MAALAFIFISAGLGFIGGLTAPSISGILTPWNLRVAFGLIVFMVIQFGIITPFRMWRQSVWVANVENMLEELFDYHDKGVLLLNAHVDALRLNPKLKNEADSLQAFLDKWYLDFEQWTKETTEEIEKLYPLEARRFKNIVVYSQVFNDGLNEIYDKWRSMLLRRLEKIDALIGRHQPSLLPE